MIPAGPQLQALDRSVPRQTCQSNLWIKAIRRIPAGPLNCKLWMRVLPCGPPQQAPDQSVPRRTSSASSGSKYPADLHQDQSVLRRTPSASSGSQCSPPDPNSNVWIKVFPAGPQQQRISKDRMPDAHARKNVVRYGIYQVAFLLK